MNRSNKKILLLINLLFIFLKFFIITTKYIKHNFFVKVDISKFMDLAISIFKYKGQYR